LRERVRRRSVGGEPAIDGIEVAEFESAKELAV
jgi:hypothetical protein